MQALSQSSFLQALGYAIANSLWQVALLWSITLLVNVCLKLSSHSRYRVAITAQLAGFAWFAVTLQFYYQQCIKATANAQLLLQNNTVVYQPGLMSNRFSILTYITKAEMLMPYLSLAYLCVLCMLAIRWLKSYRYTNQLKNNSLQKASTDIQLFVEDMAGQLGIKQKVKVYLSTLVNCPLTIGFLKPFILVPVATINHLTTQQLEAVLLHELAHIRRADYLINLLLNIIETILFFNPFTRLIAQNINKEREHCCDDWVLQFNYNAPMYAEALLRIACLQTSPVKAMKAEGKNKGELLWRVKRLLNHQQKRFNYSQQMIALVVTTCMLIFIAWLQPVKNTAKQLQQTNTVKPVKEVVIAPMAVQINNPFFNPLAVFSKPLTDAVEKAAGEVAKAELQKTVNTGLEEAAKALTTVTPTVMRGLDKLGADSNFEKATKEAQQALKKVKWNEIQQLSPFVDSAFITTAVKLALDKNNLNIDFENAKQSLLISKQQIAKLKQQQFEGILNKTYLDDVIHNATNWISSNDFVRTLNENRNTADADKKQKSLIEKKRREVLLYRRLIESRTAPGVRSYTLNLPGEAENYQQRNDDTTDSSTQVFNWSYTNPVYIEKAAEVDNNRSIPPVISYTVETLPLPAPPPAAPAKPLTHVVHANNKAEHISIIITINQ